MEQKEERTKACLFPLPPPCCCCQEKGEGETNPTTSLLPYIFSQGNSKYTFTLVSQHTKVAPRGLFIYFLEATTRHFLFPPKRYRLAKEKEKRCCCLAIIFSLNPATPIFVFFLAFLPPSYYFRTAVRISTSRIYIYFLKKSPIFRRRRRRLWRWRSQHRKFLMDEARGKNGKRLCFVKKNSSPVMCVACGKGSSNR